MINTKNLEKRWYRYKTKGVLLMASILVVLLLLIYGGYYILYKLNFSINIGQEDKPTAVMGAKVVKDINSTITDNGEMVLLAPTIPVVDLAREKAKDSREKKRVTKKRITKKRVKHQKSTKHKKLVKAKASTYLTPSELAVVNGSSSKREKKKIEFKTTSNNYMNIMKKKFNANKNPREALLIAKAYYHAGDYQSSEKWALTANSLDKNLDESWLIFAKSKEKLGKHHEALKILVAYYKKTKSPKARVLIEKIKTKSI